MIASPHYKRGLPEPLDIRPTKQSDITTDRGEISRFFARR